MTNQGHQNSPVQTIRRATLADVATVRSITRSAYRKWVDVIGREPAPLAANFRLTIQKHMIDLLEDSGDVLGLIEMIPSGKYLTIENIAVNPNAQAAGIGSLLLEHSETVATSLKLKALKLYTNAAFETNIRFYEKRGFETFRTEPIPTGGQAIHMRKMLA